MKTIHTEQQQQQQHRTLLQNKIQEWKIENKQKGKRLNTWEKQTAFSFSKEIMA